MQIIASRGQGNWRNTIAFSIQKFILQILEHFTCDQCNSSFVDDGALIAHKFNHTGEKPHKCNHCAKEFARRSQLSHRAIMRHMIRAELLNVGIPNISPRIHKICTSTRRGTLKRNSNALSVVSKLSNESPSPRIHMRVHNGTKPYHCNLCDSSFRRKTHPKSHAMTHTSTRTPVCIHQPHWRCDEVQKFSSEKWFPYYRIVAHCGQYNSELADFPALFF